MVIQIYSKYISQVTNPKNYWKTNSTPKKAVSNNLKAINSNKNSGIEKYMKRYTSALKPNKLMELNINNDNKYFHIESRKCFKILMSCISKYIII